MQKINTLLIDALIRYYKESWDERYKALIEKLTK